MSCNRPVKPLFAPARTETEEEMRQLVIYCYPMLTADRSNLRRPDCMNLGTQVSFYIHIWGDKSGIFVEELQTGVGLGVATKFVGQDATYRKAQLLSCCGFRAPNATFPKRAVLAIYVLIKPPEMWNPSKYGKVGYLGTLYSSIKFIRQKMWIWPDYTLLEHLIGSTSMVSFNF